VWVNGWLHFQVARQDISDGVADFVVTVCKVVTVTAQQDIAKLAVQMTVGVLAVF